MAKMVNLMLCIFHHNKKESVTATLGVKKEGTETYTLFPGGKKKGCVCLWVSFKQRTSKIKGNEKTLKGTLPAYEIVVFIASGAVSFRLEKS